MKFLVEIPDEDIEKLEELMKGSDYLTGGGGLQTDKLWDEGVFKQYLQEFFTILAKVILKKLYEGMLALESGVMTLEEFNKQMSGEGMRIAIEAEIKTAMEIKKQSEDKALQTKEG